MDLHVAFWGVLKLFSLSFAQRGGTAPPQPRRHQRETPSPSQLHRNPARCCLSLELPAKTCRKTLAGVVPTPPHKVGPSWICNSNDIFWLDAFFFCCCCCLLFSLAFLWLHQNKGWEERGAENHPNRARVVLGGLVNVLYTHFQGINPRFENSLTSTRCCWRRKKSPCPPGIHPKSESQGWNNLGFVVCFSCFPHS